MPTSAEGSVQGALINRDSLLSALKQAVPRNLEEKPRNVLLSGPWGSGKTTLLRQFRSLLEKDPSYHVLWFSPWEQVLDGDPKTGFIRMLKADLERGQVAPEDEGLSKRVSTLLRVLEGILSSKPAILAAEGFMPGGGAVVTASGSLVALGRALLENKTKGDEGAPGVQDVRLAVKRMLEDVRDAHGSKQLILLVDDLDRARPEAAVDILDGLYHLLMPHDSDADWPISSIWAVNTTVLEHYLYREYRELPSFDPNAYLEKMFWQRINVPPMFQQGHEINPERLWKGDLEDAGIPRAVALSELLAQEVSYAILGNLRLHARLRRDCIRYWKPSRGEETAKRTLLDFVRDARLIVLVLGFPTFREQIAPFNGIWPRFINQLNTRERCHEIGFVMNPCFRHVDSADLATLLQDLEAIAYDREMLAYTCRPDGRSRLQGDLVLLAQKGI